MSSGFRHISQGMAGATGAPRPALVNATGGVSAREHDINMATDSAASAARPLFKALVFDIGAHHRAGAAFTSRPSTFALRAPADKR